MPESVREHTSVKGNIMDAAVTLFKRFGYKKTTIEDIAREAGIGKGSVYLHFESKEDILLTLIKDLHHSMIGEWIKIVHKDLPVQEKISTMLRSNIAIMMKKREEIDLETLPPHLMKPVLKMSEETKAQRLTLIATILDPLFPGDAQSERRNRLAGVLLNVMINILFRLHMDKGFQWEEFLEDALDFLLPGTGTSLSPGSFM